MFSKSINLVWSRLFTMSLAAMAMTSFSSAALDLHVSQGQLIQLPAKAKTVFIADDKIASYQVPSADKLFIFALSPGKTSLYALSASGKVIYQDEIVVGYDTGSLNQQIATLYPEANVKAISNNNQLILRGQVPSAVMANDIVELANSQIVRTDNGQSSQVQTNTQDSSTNSSVVNQLQVTLPNQVNIRVRLAEVSRQVTNRIGLRPGSEFWGFDANQGLQWSNRDRVASLNVNDFIKDITGIKLNANSVMLDALATEGAAKLLAEPNLTALSGETASFLAGGEYPVPVSQTVTGQVIVEFREFGVGLEVTPVVLSDQRISLRIAPTVSSIDPNNSTVVNNIVVPGITTRRAETTVELASGESFMLAGLLMNDENNSVSKFPFLGDLPIVGSLFRSTQFEQQETELVIIAEAYIVKPSQEFNFNLPTDNYQRASDLERLLNLSWSAPQNEQQIPLLINTDEPVLFGENGFYY